MLESYKLKTIVKSGVTKEKSESSPVEYLSLKKVPKAQHRKLIWQDLNSNFWQFELFVNKAEIEFGLKNTAVGLQSIGCVNLCVSILM